MLIYYFYFIKSFMYENRLSSLHFSNSTYIFIKHFSGHTKNVLMNKRTPFEMKKRCNILDHYVSWIFRTKWV